MSGVLVGKSALVLEDNAIIAMELEDVLKSLGATVVAVCASAAAAAEAAAGRELDVALMDVRVRDGTSFALLSALVARGTRCLIMTGYGDLAGLPPDLGSVPVLRKPVSPAVLAEALARLVAP